MEILDKQKDIHVPGRYTTLMRLCNRLALNKEGDQHLAITDYLQ